MGRTQSQGGEGGGISRRRMPRLAVAAESKDKGEKAKSPGNGV